MALYPPAEYSSTAKTDPYAAGSPRILDVSFGTIRAELSQMMVTLEGQMSRVEAVPPEARPQFEASAGRLHDELLSLRNQLDANSDNTDSTVLMAFDAARGKLNVALVDFYEALGGPGLAISLTGVGSAEADRSKYLWMGIGCAVLAAGALGAAIYVANKPKRRGKSLGSILKPKFKRAIPAR